MVKPDLLLFYYFLLQLQGISAFEFPSLRLETTNNNNSRKRRTLGNVNNNNDDGVLNRINEKTNNLPFPMKRKLSMMNRMSETDNPDKFHDDNNNIIFGISREMGMTVSLFATYAGVMAAKVSLPSTLSMISSADSGLLLPASAASDMKQSIARLLTFSTISISMGKIILGPFIDKLGGTLSLKIALSTLGLLLGVISQTKSFNAFYASWLLVDFIFSSCWAACLNAIHEAFPSSVWSSKIGILAQAARLGNSFAFFFFALLLKNTNQNWRSVFLFSSMIQIIPLTLLSIFSPKKTEKQQRIISEKDIQKEKNDKDIISPIQILKKEVISPQFWLQLISRTTLMVFGSFLLFIPTYMIHCYSMPASSASIVGSIFAMGALLSVFFGSKTYSTLTHKKKFSLLTLLTLTSTLCTLAQVGHVSPSPAFTLSPFLGTLSIFLWGFSFAIPFYLPPSLYALEKGGSRCSATIMVSVI